MDKLRKIEALFARAGTDGERQAAASALERMKQRLAEYRRRETPVEYRFSIDNAWSRRLLIALLRRYGIEPYRRHRQRRTSIMARVPVSFVEDVLWPEFTALNEALMQHLDALAEEIIARAVCEQCSDDLQQVAALEH